MWKQSSFTDIYSRNYSVMKHFRGFPTFKAKNWSWGRLRKKLSQMLTFHFFQATFQQRLHLVGYSRAFFSYHDFLDRGLGTTKKLFNRTSNTTGTTCWEGSAYSSRAPLMFGRVRVVFFILCALRTVVCLLIVFRFRLFSLFIPLVSQITLFTRMIYMQKHHVPVRI